MPQILRAADAASLDGRRRYLLGTQRAPVKSAGARALRRYRWEYVSPTSNRIGIRAGGFVWVGTVVSVITDDGQPYTRGSGALFQRRPGRGRCRSSPALRLLRLGLLVTAMTLEPHSERCGGPGARPRPTVARRAMRGSRVCSRGSGSRVVQVYSGSRLHDAGEHGDDLLLGSAGEPAVLDVNPPATRRARVLVEALGRLGAGRGVVA